MKTNSCGVCSAVVIDFKFNRLSGFRHGALMRDDFRPTLLLFTAANQKACFFSLFIGSSPSVSTPVLLFGEATRDEPVN